MTQRTNASEAARDIEFAIDVTEPRDTILRRIDEVLLRLRRKTVRETIESLHSGGWLDRGDTECIMATLEATLQPPPQTTEKSE